MTAERLRAHWFGGPQVPFWNYDPAKLTMGVEIEYFIARTNGSSFKLATREQYLSVISYLIQNSGYTDRNLADQPGRISKDTEAGFIAIKPDFAWHILEVALPPRRDLDSIYSLLKSTLADIDRALGSVGLERLDMSCLPDVPETMELVELDRLRAHVALLETYETAKPNRNFCVPYFPALITATHFHFNVFEEAMLPTLSSLYAFDKNAFVQLTRKQTFRGEECHDFRSRLYEQTLGDDFLLRTFPAQIPHNIEQYVLLYNRSPKLFPNDRFFGVRDLSYIRPSRNGTLEFRSACSFKYIDQLIQLAEIRKFQILSHLTAEPHLDASPAARLR